MTGMICMREIARALSQVPWPEHTLRPNFARIDVSSLTQSHAALGNKNANILVNGEADTPELAIQQAINAWLAHVTVTQGADQAQVDAARTYARRRLTN